MDANFSLDRYAPLVRLMSGQDDDFVARFCGDASAVAAWRSSRRQVVGQYLKELAEDFRSAHREARALVAVSEDTNNAVLRDLMGRYFSFWFAYGRLQLTWKLSGFGLWHADASRALGLLAAHSRRSESRAPGI